MATRPMSVQDALWLTMDRPNNLMVVDGAMVLREPLPLPTVQQVMLAVTERHPVFRRRPVRQGWSWAWADDDSFDIADHVLEVDSGSSVDMAGLQRFVGEQRSRPLDKSRPLWVAYLLPDVTLDDGTSGSAVVMRFHHAIADGVRVTQLMLSTCEVADDAVVPTVVRTGAGDGPFDPVAALADGAQEGARVWGGLLRTALGAAASVTTTAAGAAAQGARVAASAASHAVSDPGGAIVSAPATFVAASSRAAADVTGLLHTGLVDVEDVVEAVRHPDRLLDLASALGAGDHRVTNDLSSVTKMLLTDSGRTVWTGKPGTTKRVAWSSTLSLADIKRIGRANGATVNDVMIAAVAGALNRYLAEQGEALDEVVWMVPVNLKPFEDNLPEELGNFFALVFLPMVLSDATHAQRLRQAQTRMARIKHSDEAVLTFGLQRVVSMSPPAMAYALTNFFANKAVGVLTNVPGPTGLLTFGGAPVEQIVGFAPCSGDQPMTTTIFSYNGTVTVGFASDADLVPDPGALAQLVVAEVESMRDAVTQPAGR